MSIKFSLSEGDGFLRNESYCEGYCAGFHFGRELSSRADEYFGEDESEEYRAGYRRGFAAIRARSAETESDRKERQPLYEEVEQMHSEYLLHGEHFTEPQWERWKELQGRVKAIGNRSWENILLELYRFLNSYKRGAKLSEHEVTAMQAIKKGLIERLAKAPR
ncbi:MAG TPA: hypothetical protein VGI46_15915 [Candidatus Acidoferrum sp.]|jgi:hypothetical protein